MSKFLFIFLSFFISSSLWGSYGVFLDAQLQNYYKMSDSNLSEAEIETILDDEKALYNKMLEDVLINKSKYQKDIQKYDQEIFELQKIVSVNKRAGNTTAVLRDEVKLKSYQILKSQNKMLIELLNGLDKNSYVAFEQKLDGLISQNQQELSKIDTTDYKQYLSWETSANVVIQLQENIKEYYALIEIDKDVANYVYRFKEKLYRLNKYAQFHLIEIAFSIDSLNFIESINSSLEEYGFDVQKILMMLSLSLILYFIRKAALLGLRTLMSKIRYLQAYAEQILEKLNRPVDTLFLVFNIDLLVYLYNDFSSVESVARSFNILYGLYASYMLYIIVNTVAAIKLSTYTGSAIALRKDVINVSIKIINFVIVIIGVLLSLYFAGVDLTAVLSGLGIGGFALAFAAKDTISNFFGTISILFSDVFAQGDWIEIDDKEGVVVEIGLRVTTIRTFDNALIAIPNGTFASKEVKNWNKRKIGRRIKMNIGVKYNSKVENLEKAVHEIREMLLSHPDIATPNTKYVHQKKHYAKLVSEDDLEGVKTTLLVYLDQFSSSSIDIMVYCFSRSVAWEEWLQTKQDVMYKIMEILQENSLEFAFPSLSVYQEK